MGFIRLKEILKEARRRYPGFSKSLAEAEALSRWELAVGKQISKHTKAICVKKKILYVEVDHPVWFTELHHKKRQILEILNQVELPDAQTEKEVLEDLFFIEKKRPGAVIKKPWGTFKTAGSSELRKPGPRKE